MNTIIEYKPANQRIPNTQYQDVLRKILTEGNKKVSIHASLPENAGSEHKYCLELSGETLRFDLSNGVPLLPIRDIKVSGAIGEIVAFVNGAHTLEDLEKFGCPKIFWERWVTKEKCEGLGLPEHELGPGSYGPGLTTVPMPDGKTFDQVEALVKQMKKMPHLRTHVITTWYAPFALGDKDQGAPRKVMVAPCHGNWIQFNVFPEENGTGHYMEMVHYQRSADVPVGLPLNLIEWTAFGMMVSYLTGIRFKTYIHMLGNPQIYDIQIPQVEELLAREPRILPTLHLRPKGPRNSIKDFRKEDFELEDYNPHEAMKVKAVI